MTGKQSRIPAAHFIAAVTIGILSLLAGIYFTDLIEENFSNAKYIFAGPGILAIVALVAVAAYFLKNRALFLAGTAGALCGPLFLGEIHSTGGYIFNAEMTAAGWQTSGLIGSVLLCTIILELQRRDVKLQFSIFFSIFITFLASIILAMWKNAG